jgi:O-antigen ligase/Tfp pilus assembly protein PilF
MKQSRQPASVTREASHYVRSITFWVSLVLLALVPLVFSTAVRRTFTLPKFAVLLVGSALLAGLLGWLSVARGGSPWRAIRSLHVGLVCLYVGAMAISTLFGVAPRVALFGSYENLMGLMTRVSFLICFLSLIIGVGEMRARLQQTLWVMTITGLLVALYGFAQFFGRDPFLSASLYTFGSSAGRILRVLGTLGHADYLGNFLLYTTPVSAAQAIASRGRARWLALIAALLSITVIIFSGTRGAMAGLVFGGLVFVLITLWRRKPNPVWRNRRMWWRAAAATLIIIAGIVLIATNPASRNIAGRARAVLAEGTSGAGRTLQWRDSLPMLQAYVIVGCGPEGFRRAFLPYKSKELAQLAPQANSESPHNACLDAAISFGLPGAILYVAVLASALALLVRARRDADREMKITFTGLLAALAAVATHNLFIFDQIPTGLYFFALAGLAQAAFNVATNGANRAASGTGRDQAALKPDGATPPSRWRTGAIALAGVSLLAAASWHAFATVGADADIQRSYVAAGVGDFEGALAAGQRAAKRFDPTGAFQFERARALALYADYAQARLNVANISKPEADRLTQMQAAAISEAMAAAQTSLAHTLTPDSSYMLLAYLALLSGDQPKLREYASQALWLDPYFANAHWLRAEAWLMDGDAAAAQREAEAALEINPNSREARQAFKRARGDDGLAQQTVDSLLKLARDYRSQGKLRKARRRLQRALQKSSGNCLECHRQMALIYETEEQTEKAINEWQAVAVQATERATIQEALSRINLLKQKAAGQ